MRELRVIGLDVDGRHIICEGPDPADKFTLQVDDRLRAAVRGDRSLGQTLRDKEVKGVLRPRDIQARIRAGASVEQVAASSGMDVSKVERFAHPVLLERARAAELASAAHPVLADGPAVTTLQETITTALVARGLSPEATEWDAWRGEDGRWVVQMAWQAGLSDNVAHFRFSPGAHGGTVAALDDAASELIDPAFERPVLRPVAPVAQLELEEQPAPAQAPVEETPAPAPAAPAPAPRARRAKAKPAVPGWEDVLLGVRSSGER
ncbi:septation protein SepH [Mycolicibacterium vinylchloridicum]|uniref:septation protein SepH n=1 Tax=Mycolicibacterium vinylchloridicum TaxID=2736928 RepID=UPI0015CEE3BE|nr:septation protein SepH [Mycolicibacterium vinylchloridicum]